MKIGVISEVFLPNIGGMEIRYNELGQTLIKQGHEFEIYTLRLNPSDLAKDIVNGIPVYRITKAFRYFTSIWGLRNYPDVIWFTLDLLKQKKELEKFDVIIFNKWPVIPSIVLPFFIKNKFVIDWCEIYDTTFWRFIYRLMTWRKEILHSCVNQRIGNILNEQYGVSRNNIKAIISGIDSSLYSCKSEDKKNKSILFLGRLAQHKNPEYVIKAFLYNQLGEKKYELNLAGSGPLYESLKSQYDNQHNIKFWGRVDESQKNDLIKQSTLLVLPSKREGFPVVCAEGAAAGTPVLTVIYPDNGTVSVVTQFGIGWLANPNLEELAEKIERYGDCNYWEWHPVSRRCVEMAETVFDWNVVVDDLLKFLARKLP
ncbi:glycosyltransferase family 4 protein [Crocosphaera sp. XPORK-15E]|uniref:glycosyltransferase family 4 protein n=1 Tax=Crocosphaera sp. XPORK-15E TaxID=3110247 RepID=UPI002B1ED3E1|nr:glycosyltransferase family 4 protein [Crocosphaera sp. XPORK-15E]MEA5536087.1 glycosyltransferase family 4 protein [Crocosphaera sp. XPORK-15E]